MPVAAYGGRRAIMEMVAPLGPVYQAGTLSGNPLGMAAGIATLDLLAKPDAYDALSSHAAAVAQAVADAGARHGVPVQTASVGGMWGFFLAADPVTDYASARRSDTARFARLFHALLDRGVYIAPSAFEAGFVSLAHDDETLALTRAALDSAFASIA